MSTLPGLNGDLLDQTLVRLRMSLQLGNWDQGHAIIDGAKGGAGVSCMFDPRGPLEQLGLSLRLEARLRMMKINTVVDLTEWTGDELATSWQVGPVSVTEIEAKLGANGLGLRRVPL